MLLGEGTVQADLDEAVLAALGVQVVDGLVDGLADGAHGDDDVFGGGIAVVVEQGVVGANLGVHLVHVLLHNGGKGVIEGVAGLAGLEEDIAVLGGAPQDGVLRVQGVLPEGVHGVHVHQFLQVVIIPDLNLLQLVGGAEPVEEVQEGDPALDGGKVGDGGEVHNLLDAALAHHGKAGLAAGVNVGVVAEDVQGVGGHAPGGDVDDAGEQLAGHLVHIGDHQQQALGSGEGGGEGAGGQRAVDGTGGAGLGLHLNDLYPLAEDVGPAIRRPFVGHLRHHGRRGDGVNGGNVGERIGNMGGGVVTVHCFHFSCHSVFLPVLFLRSMQGKRVRTPSGPCILLQF